MSVLIASLKSKPQYLGDCVEHYIMRIIEFRDVFYVDWYGIKRSVALFGIKYPNAGFEELDLTYCTVDYAQYLIHDVSNELSSYSSYHDKISRQTTRYYKDLSSWQKHCALSNYGLDANGIPFPPQGFEWDMKESKIYKPLQ